MGSAGGQRGWAGEGGVDGGAAATQRTSTSRDTLVPTWDWNHERSDAHHIQPTPMCFTQPLPFLCPSHSRRDALPRAHRRARAPASHPCMIWPDHTPAWQSGGRGEGPLGSPARARSAALTAALRPQAVRLSRGPRHCATRGPNSAPTLAGQAPLPRAPSGAASGPAGRRIPPHKRAGPRAVPALPPTASCLRLTPPASALTLGAAAPQPR